MAKSKKIDSTRYLSSRRVPRYMEDNAMRISGQLLLILWRRGPKAKWYGDTGISRYEIYEIARKADDTWWIHIPSACLAGWTRIPKTVGERVQKIYEIAEEL